MIAQVKTWGNSQGIRLSKELLALAGIQNNDYLDVEIEGTVLCEQMRLMDLRVRGLKK